MASDLWENLLSVKDVLLVASCSKSSCMNTSWHSFRLGLQCFSICACGFMRGTAWLLVDVCCCVLVSYLLTFEFCFDIPAWHFFTKTRLAQRNVSSMTYFVEWNVNDNAINLNGTEKCRTFIHSLQQCNFLSQALWFMSTEFCLEVLRGTVNRWVVWNERWCGYRLSLCLCHRLWSKHTAL